uniref:Claudin 34 n=1 Tax=Anolis carolinensis TaxID=28377 RepID=A0A803T094_ANOCA
ILLKQRGGSHKMGLAEGNFPDAARLVHLAYIRLIAFIFMAIGWALCLMATGGEEWRVWDPRPGTGMEKMWIGIWGVCFVGPPPPDKPKVMQCLEFQDEHFSLPTEIFIAQDLMPLASILASLALAFVSFTLWNLYHKGRPKNFLLIFLWVGGILSLLSGAVSLIPLLWNMHSVIVNEGIVFPESFHLPYLPNEQNIGFAIYAGIVASGFQLTSSILILSEKCCFNCFSFHFCSKYV